MSEMLELKGITKRIGDFELQNLDLRLESGSVMGFIGPNGAGKTTTIKIIMGLMRADSGELRLFGQDAKRAGPQLRKRIGFVYDEPHMNGKLNALDLGTITSPFYPSWDQRGFRALLDRFDVPPAKVVDELSKGMKMKLQLALALCHGAELIVMDEPTGGLDPVMRSEFLDLLYEVIQDEGKSLLFSTHITDDLERIADSVTFIDRGRLVFSAPKDEILASRALVRGPLDVLTPDLEALMIGVRKTASAFSALTDRAQELSQFPEAPLVIEGATLDDIMVYTVRRNF